MAPVWYVVWYVAAGRGARGGGREAVGGEWPGTRHDRAERAGRSVTSTSARAGRPAGDVLDGLADAPALAQSAGRGDLVERLDAAVRRLRSEEATVAVVGEFKQGKSTLVNALLRTDIC